MKISFFTKFKQDHRSEGPWRHARAFCHGAAKAPPPTLFSGFVHLWCESEGWREQVCEPENAHVPLHLKSWQEQLVREQPCASRLLCFS